MMKVVIAIFVIFSLAGCEAKSDPNHILAVQEVLKKTDENMVFVKGGTFMMGDTGDGKYLEHFTNRDELHNATKVTLSSYYINKYETTWGELVTYLKDVDRYDQYNEVKYRYDQPYIAVDDITSPNYVKRAARAPNWYEAEGYCLWLAEKTGKPYALPTEAQWEYAARSRGERVRYATNDGITLVLDDYMLGEYFSGDPIKNKTVISDSHDPLAIPKGNAYGITVNEYEWYTRIVGSYPPNKLGIYDMTGNAHEWVRDWYEKDHYKKIEKNNPQGPSEAKYWGPPISQNDTPTKVQRDWVTSSSTPGTSRGAIYGRSYAYVDDRSNGFRCALNSLESIR
jgi:sulfatase modifying factor 1